MSDDVYYEGEKLTELSREKLEVAQAEYYNLLFDVEVEMWRRDGVLKFF